MYLSLIIISARKKWLRTSRGCQRAITWQFSFFQWKQREVEKQRKREELKSSTPSLFLSLMSSAGLGNCLEANSALCSEARPQDGAWGLGEGKEMGSYLADIWKNWQSCSSPYSKVTGNSKLCCRFGKTQCLWLMVFCWFRFLLLNL